MILSLKPSLSVTPLYGSATLNHFKWTSCFKEVLNSNSCAKSTQTKSTLNKYLIQAQVIFVVFLSLSVCTRLIMHCFSTRGVSSSLASVAQKASDSQRQMYTTHQGSDVRNQANMENSGRRREGGGGTVMIPSNGSWRLPCECFLSGWLVCREQPGGGASFTPREETDTHRLPLLYVWMLRRPSSPPPRSWWGFLRIISH